MKFSKNKFEYKGGGEIFKKNSSKKTSSSFSNSYSTVLYQPPSAPCLEPESDSTDSHFTKSKGNILYITRKGCIPKFNSHPNLIKP